MEIFQVQHPSHSGADLADIQALLQLCQITANLVAFKEIATQEQARQRQPQAQLLSCQPHHQPQHQPSQLADTTETTDAVLIMKTPTVHPPGIAVRHMAIVDLDPSIATECTALMDSLTMTAATRKEPRLRRVIPFNPPTYQSQQTIQ